MEQNKKKLVFKEEADFETVVYQDNVIKVKKFISFDDILYITQNYIHVYFETPSGFILSSHNHIGAEYSFILDVLERCTDIQLTIQTETNGQAVLVIDDLIKHKDLISDIQAKISNYYDVYNIVLSVVSDIKEQTALERSLGSVVDEAIKKLTTFLSNLKLKDGDISELKKITEEITSSEFVDKLRNVDKINSSKSPRKKVAKKE